MGAEASCRCTVATASRTVATRAANAAAGVGAAWRRRAEVLVRQQPARRDSSTEARLTAPVVTTLAGHRTGEDRWPPSDQTSRHSIADREVGEYSYGYGYIVVIRFGTQPDLTGLTALRGVSWSGTVWPWARCVYGGGGQSSPSCRCVFRP